MRFEILKNDVPKYLANFDAKLKQRLLKALIQCGDLIADETRLLAPEDTGLLKSSIASVLIDTRRLIVEVQVNALSDKGRPYPLFQEYGWRTRAGNKIEGRFYLHGAMANKHDECVEIIQKALEKTMFETAADYFSVATVEEVAVETGEAVLLL